MVGSFSWRHKEHLFVILEFALAVPKPSSITKTCSLCLHEKLAIITFPYPDELLNKRSELVTKCRHENKFLLKKFNSND